MAYFQSGVIFAMWSFEKIINSVIKLENTQFLFVRGQQKIDIKFTD